MKLTPYNHQSSAIKELTKRAEIFYGNNWQNLCVRPRFSSLVIGPTGSGKTSIVASVAASVNAEYLRISAPEWMPLGAHNRGGKETLPFIAKKIEDSHRLIICIDEIDKLCYDSSWSSYQKGEIYDLLDYRVPPTLQLAETEEESAENEATKEQLRNDRVLNINAKMGTTVLIIGVGTFQDFFEKRHSLGFGNDSFKNITAYDIAKRLPRELANRFNGTLILLPPLTADDYRNMASSTALRLPHWIRAAFLKSASQLIENARTTEKGCRYIEEAVLMALEKAHPNQHNPITHVNDTEY